MKKWAVNGCFYNAEDWKDIRIKEQEERIIYLVNERKKLEELLYMSNENYIEKSKIKEWTNTRQMSIDDMRDSLELDYATVSEIKRLETEIDILQELMGDK